MLKLLKMFDMMYSVNNFYLQVGEDKLPPDGL